MSKSIEPKVFIGGSATNTCFYLSKLLKIFQKENDFQVFLLAAVGNDTIGDKIRQELKKAHIPMDYVIPWQGNSGRTEIELNENGERRITRFHSVSTELGEIIQNSSFAQRLKNSNIHVNHSLDTIAAISEYQPEIFSMDISGILPRENTDSNRTKQDFSRKFHQNFEVIHVKNLFGNNAEFSYLLRLLDLIESLSMFENAELSEKTRIIRKFIKMYNFETVFIKAGKYGAVMISLNNSYSEKARILENIIDTTGAGDAFNAGAIFGLLSNYEPKKILKLAVYMGTEKCAYLGAQSYPIEDDKNLPLLF